MILRKTLIFIVFVSALFFSSCTAIFVPKKQKIEVKTGDKQSEVYVKGIREGRGKRVTIKKVEKLGMQEIVVRVPEHKDYHKVIVAKKRDPIFWAVLPLDLVAAGTLVPIIIAASPMNKFFKFDKQVTIKNPHLLPIRKEDEKMIQFQSVKLEIEDASKEFPTYNFRLKNDLVADLKLAKEKKLKGEVKEEIKKKKKGGDKELLDNSKNKISLADTKFSENIYKVLKDGGYVDSTNNILKSGNNSIKLQAIIVGGEHISASFKKNVKPEVSLVKVGLDIDWIIKNEYNQIIDSIRVSERSDEFLQVFSPYINNKYEDIFPFKNALSDAVDNSLLALFENDKFQQHLKITEIEKEVLEKITINKPKSTVKNSKDALQSAVIVKNKDGKGHGSGFAISNDGYVLTNFHVVAGRKAGDYKDVVAVLPNGSEADLEVVRVDPTNDLALLKVNATFNKAFLLTDVKKYDLLDQVFTVGAPASVDLGNTLTTGVLSSERKSDGIDKIQLNMSVSPGNSGGPVFDNETGVLHGVISSKIVGNNTEGIAFAVPSHNIMKNMYLEVK